MGASLETIAADAALHARTVGRIEAAESRPSRGAVAVQAALEAKGIEFLKASDGRVVGFRMPPEAGESGQRPTRLAFAALIKPARLALQLSLDEVAARAGVHPRTVARVESRAPNAEATVASVAVRDALQSLGIEFLSPSDVRGEGFRLRMTDN
ncbi:helix-turn-helix domain-containing protein [Bosea sp. BH3]|uniref:helix-turn-helix domain-containing protein n=1 Tax=Bosea sp. BH3 TaxID=2871701 RepID=UPI0021CAF0F0|nr:helix-turn-helix transcriptional regulator [Bosea sp. BH3]MCU4180179.1 helix-turn-helix domain-containing protein [Bosea sp. BH3]